MDDFWGSLKVLWSFALHILAGMAFFTLVACAVVGLHYIGIVMVRAGVDAPYLMVMRFLEGLLFVADVAVTSFWVVRSTGEHLADIRNPSRVEWRARARAEKRGDWRRL